MLKVVVKKITREESLIEVVVGEEVKVVVLEGTETGVYYEGFRDWPVEKRYRFELVNFCNSVGELMGEGQYQSSLLDISYDIDGQDILGELREKVSGVLADVESEAVRVSERLDRMVVERELTVDCIVDKIQSKMEEYEGDGEVIRLDELGLLMAWIIEGDEGY